MAKLTKLAKATRSLTTALDQAESDERVVELKLKDIEPDPEQPRKAMDKDRLKQLAESIKAKGLLQPIIVVKNLTGEGAVYRIRYGERRWQASVLAELKTIKAVVAADDMSAAEVLAAQLTENLHRDDMNVPDTVAALMRLVGEVGRKGAAEQLAKPQSWVSKMMQIGEAGGAVARAIESTEVKDLEALYNLARIQKQDELVAGRIVSKWAAGDVGRARQDTQAMLDKLSGKDEKPSANAVPAAADKPAAKPTAPQIEEAPSEAAEDGDADRTEDEGDSSPKVTKPKTRTVASTDDEGSTATESVTTIRQQGGEGTEYKPTRSLADVFRVLSLKLESGLVTLVTDRGDLVFDANAFNDVVGIK